MKNAMKRIIVVFIGVMLQLLFAVFTRSYFIDRINIINIFYRLISIVIVLSIIRNSTRLSNDISWIVLIAIFPIFGTIIYITLGRSYRNSKLLKSIMRKENEYKKYLVQDSKIKNEINIKDLDQLKYIMNNAKEPVTKNNSIKYYPLGDDFLPDYIDELKKAKKFIFMEYFVINDGYMWNTILDILIDKVKSGVDVRIMYDDVGSLSTLTTTFPSEMKQYGIKCISFNKITPFKGLFMNNRDHRKVTIIDGKTAFSGGLNISDEYINKKRRFGKWKDNAIKIVGPAIWNLTVMFLTLWNANVDEDKNIEKFRNDFSNDKIKDDGYVSAYSSSPLRTDLIGEDIYLNMINSAKRYLYIFTPYLIIDTDMINSLVRAAKRGVDVRIVVPGIPDKRLVYTVTSSYFEILTNGGVKIYKYIPGFIHSKVFICDDKRATVGTINMDYRSLYLHFENGIYLEDVSEIKTIKNDVVNTLKVSRLISLREAKPNFILGIWQAILRVIAPLL